MSSKLLSKFLCKNNKANSHKHGVDLQLQKKGNLVVSGPHDNFDKLPKKNSRTRNFVWSGAVIFIVFYLLIRVGGGGGDTGSVGLVETRVFILRLNKRLLYVTAVSDYIQK